MSVATQKRISEQEYLSLERQAEVRHEYVAGEMFAMAGGSRRHSRLAVNFASALNQRLTSKGCEVFNSDMKLKVEATSLFAYPDLQVVCGKSRFVDSKEDILLNPLLICEVLSESTAAWDRGMKFWHYRHVESLLEYVLVSQDNWLVEIYRRQPNSAWLMESLDGGDDILKMESVGCEVPLKEIYSGIVFESET